MIYIENNGQRTMDMHYFHVNVFVWTFFNSPMDQLNMLNVIVEWEKKALHFNHPSKKKTMNKMLTWISDYFFLFVCFCDSQSLADFCAFFFQLISSKSSKGKNYMYTPKNVCKYFYTSEIWSDLLQTNCEINFIKFSFLCYSFNSFGSISISSNNVAYQIIACTLYPML